MKDMIAFCGLDCEKCEAWIATQNNDDALRAKVAANWSKLNGITILPEMINCDGCRVDGVKTVFCDSLCKIRQCALAKNYPTCGSCSDLSTCETIKMITKHNSSALSNLKS